MAFDRYKHVVYAYFGNDDTDEYPFITTLISTSHYRLIAVDISAAEHMVLDQKYLFRYESRHYNKLNNDITDSIIKGIVVPIGTTGRGEVLYKYIRAKNVKQWIDNRESLIYKRLWY